MTRIEEALLEAVAVLNHHKIPYILVGGLAAAQWNHPRATIDVDLTIWVEPECLTETVQLLGAALKPRVANPLEFVKRSRVLPAQARNGVPVDLVFGGWPFEREAIENAEIRTVAGVSIRVASIDYLLLQKLVSDRPKDTDDAAALLQRHRDTVDYRQLEANLELFAQALDNPEILNRYHRLRKV